MPKFPAPVRERLDAGTKAPCPPHQNLIALPASDIHFAPHLPSSVASSSSAGAPLCVTAAVFYCAAAFVPSPLSEE